METKTLGNLTYLIDYPKGYDADNKYPIIYFLHGAGTRGTDTKALENNGFFEAVHKHEKFPFITVAPLCHENTWFDLFESLKALAIAVSHFDFADSERIYLVGTSMGAYAAWELAMSIPDVFAAVIPVCGGGMYWNADRLKNLPIWAFHGEMDNVVLCEESKKMVDAVNSCGGSAKLTLYPDVNHSAWIPTYSNYAVFEWLLSNKRTAAENISNKFTDQTVYG